MRGCSSSKGRKGRAARRRQGQAFMRRTADDQREEGAAGTHRERACPTQPRICSYPCCLFRTVPRAPFSSPHSLSSADACWLAGADAGSLARSLACRIDGKGEICVREDEESKGSEGTIGGKESDRNGEKVSHPDRISPTSLAPFSLCVFSCSRAALSLAVAAAAAVGGEEEQRTNHGAKEPCWASYFHFEHELSGGLWVGREQGIVCVVVFGGSSNEEARLLLQVVLLLSCWLLLPSLFLCF